MDIKKKYNSHLGVFQIVKGFLRPFYDNGSALSLKEGFSPKIYVPIYSKKKI